MLHGEVDNSFLRLSQGLISWSKTVLTQVKLPLRILTSEQNVRSAVDQPDERTRRGKPTYSNRDSGVQTMDEMDAREEQEQRSS